MRWIAPTSKDTATATLEKRLWEAADQLRATSGLTAAQYSQPVLGLIFLQTPSGLSSRRQIVQALSGQSHPAPTQPGRAS